MEITESQIPQGTVLELSGRLDGIASPAVDNRVNALVAAEVRRVIFDCSRLSYASSAGLRVFLSSAKKLKSVGGQVVVTGLVPSVKEVFALSGFLDVLTVYPSLADAVKSLK